MKTENLKNAYNAIKSGKIIDCNGVRCWVSFKSVRNGVPVGKKRCICWRNFGQSAQPLKLSELRWIFNTIANSKDFSFTVVDSIY